MTAPRRNKEATKAALMRAGADAFAAKGFEAATLEDIAGAAGVNKAMIAYYFHGKAGLFHAILEEAVGYVLTRVREEVDPLEDPAAQFQAFILAMAQMMAERPFFPAMLLRDYQSGRFQKDKALVAQLVQFSEITRRILGAGEAQGTFRPTDHHKTHLTIVGALAFFVASQRFRDELPAIPGREGEAMPMLKGYAAHLAAVLLDGIRA